MNLQDKVCIVTGSAQGLGREFCHRLLQAGGRVLVSDLREDTGLAIVAEFCAKFGPDRAHFVQCDVTKDTDLDNLLSSATALFGQRVDIFVNNAGINTNWGWRKCMEVNILAVMSATEIALERMKKQPKKGTIVNTASMAGIMAGFAEDSLAYFVSKHGVVTLTRTLNKCFHESGVEVKAICPSWADTEIVSGVDGEERKTAINKMPYFVIPDTSELMVRMMVMMGLVIRKITGG